MSGRGTGPGTPRRRRPTEGIFRSRSDPIPATLRTLRRRGDSSSSSDDSTPRRRATGDPPIGPAAVVNPVAAAPRMAAQADRAKQLKNMREVTSHSLSVSNQMGPL